MPVSIDEVVKATEILSSKDQRGTYINAKKINKYAPIALNMLVDALITQNGVTIKNSEGLSELRVTESKVVPRLTGRLAKPSNFFHYESTEVNAFYTNKDGKKITAINEADFLNKAQFTSRKSSLVSKPTRQRPIVTSIANSLEYFPKDVGVITLNYLKKPSIPFWNYTELAGEAVFSADGGILTNPNGTAGSTDFEVPSTLRNDLIKNMCQLLGITIGAADLIQTTQLLNSAS